jgi:hypothetical protein
MYRASGFIFFRHQPITTMIFQYTDDEKRLHTFLPAYIPGREISLNYIEMIDGKFIPATFCTTADIMNRLQKVLPLGYKITTIETTKTKFI